MVETEAGPTTAAHQMDINKKNGKRFKIFQKYKGRKQKKGKSTMAQKGPSAIEVNQDELFINNAESPDLFELR